MHASMHTAAIVAMILGLVATFKSHTLKLPTPTPNLYRSELPPTFRCDTATLSPQTQNNIANQKLHNDSLVSENLVPIWRVKVPTGFLWREMPPEAFCCLHPSNIEK